MSNLKRSFLVGAGALLLASCDPKEQKTIIIGNSLNYERQELVSIPYGEFVGKFTADSLFKISDQETGTEIANIWGY